MQHTQTHTAVHCLLFLPFFSSLLCCSLTLLLTVKVCFDRTPRSAVVCVCVFFILHGLTVLESRPLLSARKSADNVGGRGGQTDSGQRLMRTENHVLRVRKANGTDALSCCTTQMLNVVAHTCEVRSKSCYREMKEGK